MKFKVEVSKIYVQAHIVEADDADHAKEIGAEISDVMSTDYKTFFESTRNVTQVDDSNQVTYEPEQDYLK
ncbi:hypothetical protein [Acinetobacter bereziniae]|uniref:hypothetical protein n=1 Tax=Acinetobacter bereziniae TaxID=106648 RepID=UPI000EF6BFA0|nr:hypothetical protein [Acinetobacter bereziniae]